MGIFRAYDIRGIYGKDLTDKVALNLGKALGTFLKGNKTVCVGFDTRPSSLPLFKNFVSGLTSTGCKVISLGLVPNPIVYFYAWKNKVFGSMITASVDADEFTLVENNDKKIELVKVGEFIDKRIKNKDWKLYKVLSFNPQTGKVVFSQIKNVFRHEINEDLFEIKLAHGRTVKVTGSHSLYTYRSGSLGLVPTTELKKGDLVPVPMCIKPSQSFEKEINVAKEFFLHKDKIKRTIIITGKDVLEIIKKRMINSERVKRVKLKIEGKEIILKRRKELNLSRREASLKCGISPQTIQRIELETSREFVKLEYIKKYLKFLGIDPESFIEKIDFFKGSWKDGRCLNKIRLRDVSDEEIQSIKDCTLYCPGGKGKVKNIIKISPEFARLVGYYVAEGSIENECRVRFSLGPETRGHERLIIEDIKSILKEIFGIQPHVYYRKNGTVIVVDNSIIYYIFAKLLGFEGRDSKTKKIPRIIFNLPQKHQLEFLKGLFLGDGTLTSRMIKFSSSSFELINGLSYLLLNFNVGYGFRTSKDKTFDIIISNYEDVEKLKKIWSWHWNAKNVKKVKWKNRRKLYKEFKNLLLLPIKEIKRVKPTSRYVYDFSVKDETFITGIGGVCCHNSHNPVEWNGFKILKPNGVSFTEEIKLLEDIFHSKKFTTGKGEVEEGKNVIKEYTNFLKNKIGKVKGRVVVDFLGGAGIGSIETLREVGLEIIPLHDKPDASLYGFHRLEPWGDLLNTAKETIKKEKADFGVAFDCDADRSVFIDSSGNFIDPSIMNAIFIENILKGREGQKIVATYDCASELEDFVKKLGGKLVWNRVGHGFIEQRVIDEKALFAGEQSSHFYFNIFYPFSDGTLSTLYLCKILNETDKRLDELASKIKFHPIAKLYINAVTDEKKIRVVEKIKNEFPAAIDIMDGIKMNLNEIEWVLIRASQTLPEVNLCVEAINDKRLEWLVEKYTKLIEQKIRETND